MPNNRAYELVTPPDTGSVVPGGRTLGGSDAIDCFETAFATADGKTVAFTGLNGVLPGFDGNGLFSLYEAHREADGWRTVSKTASGAQTAYPGGGLCISPDHGYSTLSTGEEPRDQGTLPWNGASTSYIRYPDDSYQLVGAGSLGVEPGVNVRWISSGGSHIIFTAKRRLEPPAPAGVGSASGYSAENPPVGAIYDRTPDGLYVVSLLPTNLPPNFNTETTRYLGTSRDGTAVLFEVTKTGGSTTLYLRRNNQTTVPVATGLTPGQVRHAGISANGLRVFYVESEGSSEGEERGNIYLFDIASNSTVPIVTNGTAAVINVSADGSHVYFMSRHVLTAEENGFQATAEEGKPNLYVWDAEGQTTKFVAVLAEEDVVSAAILSLTNWVPRVVSPQQNALKGSLNDPSRTTSSGSTFVFESRANIANYDTAGHTQIYRFSASDGGIVCVSCPASGEPSADAVLVRTGFLGQVNSLARIQNVTEDGSRVFFHTAEPLAAADENAVGDVYQWEDGQVSLISGGRGPFPSSLYAMSANGDDVFFTTTDRLLPQDESSVVSIYDARVIGGFSVPPALPPCSGEGCRPPASAPPSQLPPTTRSFCGPRTAKVFRTKARKGKKARHHKRRHQRRRVSGCQVVVSR